MTPSPLTRTARTEAEWYLVERREVLGMTKAELARRAGLAPEPVRRLFSADSPNPAIITLAALSDTLDLELVPRQRSAT